MAGLKLWQLTAVVLLLSKSLAVAQPVAVADDDADDHEVEVVARDHYDVAAAEVAHLHRPRSEFVTIVQRDIEVRQATSVAPANPPAQTSAVAAAPTQAKKATATTPATTAGKGKGKKGKGKKGKGKKGKGKKGKGKGKGKKGKNKNNKNNAGKANAAAGGASAAAGQAAA